jgi:hypothetical protein
VKLAGNAQKPQEMAKTPVFLENPAGRQANDLCRLMKYPCRFEEYLGRCAGGMGCLKEYPGRPFNDLFRPAKGAFRLTNDAGSS